MPPINASEIKLVPKTPPTSPAVPAYVYDEIDSLLRPDWDTYELDDSEDEAGRSYSVTDLTSEQQMLLITEYRKTGWTVHLHGAHHTSAYTDPNSPAGKYRGLRFIPKNLQKK